jgi:delta(3,5)-delta(2,4)-dienoyl-CoA isomerase
MGDKNIIYEIRGDRVAIITINRPKKMNAFTADMFLELEKAYDDILNSDKDVRAIVLTSTGTHFTAGLDLNEAMKINTTKSQFEDIARYSLHL